jgi:hypothetical protein
MATNNSNTNQPVIQLSELDFNQIKIQLANFLRNKPELQDYDFSASGWAYLIDLLAYNDAYLAFYLNLIASEMFIDSAQLRDSIVSKAKLLGYVPRSNRSARATIQVDFTPDNIVSNVIDPSLTPAQIQIPATTSFSGVGTDGTEYDFIIAEPLTLYLVNPSSEASDYNPVTNKFTTQFDIIEGNKITQQFTITTDPEQKFVLANAGVDIDSIVVSVQESITNLSSTLFTKATDITEINSNSKVYYLQQTENDLYEIYFGDGVLSAGFSVNPDGTLNINGLAPGNIVIITYIVCHGSAANNIKQFTSQGPIGIPTPNTTSILTEVITTITQATGGEDEESNQSIKTLAPLNFEMQNRAVTKSDFEQLIQKNYPRIDSISVWGGEDNNPPQYGKVYISIKPSAGFVLDNANKDYIINTIIRPICTLTQDPVIVDPDYLYLIINSNVKYNSNATTSPQQVIQFATYNNIVDYAKNTLEKFNQNFEFSPFVELVDSSDPSIDSNLTNLTMKKIIYPILGLPQSYDIEFVNPIDIFDTRNIYGKSVYSSNFLFVDANSVCFFAEDSFGSTTLSLFEINSKSNSIVKVKEMGTINYQTGEINIDQLFVPFGFIGNMTNIEFYAKPLINDINSARNVILIIDPSDIHVTVEPK